MVKANGKKRPQRYLWCLCRNSLVDSCHITVNDHRTHTPSRKNRKLSLTWRYNLWINFNLQSIFYQFFLLFCHSLSRPSIAGAFFFSSQLLTTARRSMWTVFFLSLHNNVEVGEHWAHRKNGWNEKHTCTQPSANSMKHNLRFFFSHSFKYWLYYLLFRVHGGKMYIELRSRAALVYSTVRKRYQSTESENRNV